MSIGRLRLHYDAEKSADIFCTFEHVNNDADSLQPSGCNWPLVYV